MSNYSTRRWLVHLPATQLADAVTRYGSEAKVRELLSQGVSDIITALDKGELSQQTLAQFLALASAPYAEAVSLVSLRVDYEAHHEFDARLGAYGAKTAAVRFILAALNRATVYTPYHVAEHARYREIIDILGGETSAV